ncbi:MAG: NAD-dependent epimerase/dehydratase family protein [Syntrophorhabdaceae bacterium]|nr:NAD-dependent epimerase/dehydratase family protein [Syntrophorhabdaceae bacterium]
MYALVTGGAGFIGSHVAKSLLDMDIKTVVMDDLSGGFVENVPEKAEFIEMSILDYDGILNLFEKYRFSYVFHLAAYAAEGLSHFIRRFNYTNNLLGSVNLINASVLYKVNTFVFTSSIAVYGSAQTPMNESMVPVPEDPYGVSKLAVEQDLKAAHEQFGLEYIVFRPHNVYGEHQNIGDPYRNVVGIFMNKIMMGEPCPVFGDGLQTRAFTHIDDVAPVIAKSIFNAKAKQQVFNVGSDKPYSVIELAEKVQRAMGRKTGIVHLPERNEVKHAFSDHSKLQNILGYTAKIDLDEGLERMAAWVKKVGARKSKPFTNIEIKEGVPPSWLSLIEQG